MSELEESQQDRIKKLHLRLEGKISRRQLLTMASPLGKVTLDTATCTGCGLCALECPSGALTASTNRETEVYQLLFRHNLCIACGQCVEVCPEQCLRLERTLELDRLGQPAVVLSEDSLGRCAQCGAPTAPRSMLANLGARIRGRGGPVAQLDLCSTCRLKGVVDNMVNQLGRK